MFLVETHKALIRSSLDTSLEMIPALPPITFSWMMIGSYAWHIFTVWGRISGQSDSAGKERGSERHSERMNRQRGSTRMSWWRLRWAIGGKRHMYFTRGLAGQNFSPTRNTLHLFSDKRTVVHGISHFPTSLEWQNNLLTCDNNWLWASIN